MNKSTFLLCVWFLSSRFGLTSLLKWKIKTIQNNDKYIYIYKRSQYKFVPKGKAFCLSLLLLQEQNTLISEMN